MSVSQQVARPGDSPGLAIFRDARERVLFVWLSASLAADAARFDGSAGGLERRLVEATARVEVEADFESAAPLVGRFVELLSVHRPEANVVLTGEPSYPHVKITAGEQYPRMLVTRRVREDGATYYGPLLPETAVRRLLEATRSLFRLRTCTTDVDGTETHPCTEHGLGRCLAPCVRALCDGSTYARAVEDVRMLLSGEGFELARILDERMEAAAAAFEFEDAARWRDVRAGLSKLAADLRVRPDLSTATDLLVVRQSEDGLLAAQLMTTDGGHVIGRRTFVHSLSQAAVGASEEWATTQVLAQIHDRYIPKRLALPIVTPRVGLVVDALSERAGREIEVVRETGDDRPARLRVAEREATKLLVERLAARRAESPGAALDELAGELGLQSPPIRIEALDVAHMAGRLMTASLVVAVDGYRCDGDAAAWLVEGGADVDAIEQAVSDRLSVDGRPLPDLFVIIGGAAHLRAARRALEAAKCGSIPVIAISRPTAKTRSSLHVIAEDAGGPGPAGDVDVGAGSRDAVRRVDFAETPAARRLLIRLRDDAGHAAESAYRYHRELAGFARRPGSPKVVEVRLDDPEGDASDLRPVLKLDPAARARLARRAQSATKPAGGTRRRQKGASS